MNQDEQSHEKDLLRVNCQVKHNLYERMKKYTEQYGKLHFEKPPQGQQANEFIDQMSSPAPYQAIQEYEVFLQDKPSDYIGPGSSEISINDQFVINSLEALEKYDGHCTQEGADAIKSRLGDVETEYFRQLKGLPTAISRISYQTSDGDADTISDFWQYNAIKLGVLHGGLNHLQSSTTGRQQRGERVVGAALRTLIEKYKFSRDQFFITSEQGFICDDSVEGIPPKVVIEELCY